MRVIIFCFILFVYVAGCGESNNNCPTGEITIRWPEPCVGVDGGPANPETRSEKICLPSGCADSPGCSCFDEDPCQGMSSSGLYCMYVVDNLITCGCV
jgi:hypothetical protein